MVQFAKSSLSLAAFTIAAVVALPAQLHAAGNINPIHGASSRHYQLAHFLRVSEKTLAPGIGIEVADQATASAINAAVIENGQSVFQQNCAFCHGRDAAGGESGPDLTRSKLVADDVAGDKISDVVRNGRIEKGMPKFNLSETDLTATVAFIHSQQTKYMSQSGKRRGVEVADLQTGNVEEGKKYFNGAGGCSSCHSPTGNLAGIATKYQGLQLEQRMLYPRDVKSKATITLPSGETIEGTVAYMDEFTLAIRDSTNTYRSWPLSTIKYTVTAPLAAHVELFSKYTDADIHNLMAYIQTLR
jgi:cytochrome c oxidase cbb3-type subunit 3